MDRSIAPLTGQNDLSVKLRFQAKTKTISREFHLSVFLSPHGNVTD